MIIRLGKVSKMLRVGRLMKNFEKLSQSPAFKVLYVVMTCFMFTHWAGCGFFLLARWQVCSALCCLQSGACNTGCAASAASRWNCHNEELALETRTGAVHPRYVIYQVDCQTPGSDSCYGSLVALQQPTSGSAEPAIALRALGQHGL